LDIQNYLKLKNFKKLFKEFGVKGFLKLYWNNIGIKRKVFLKLLK